MRSIAPILAFALALLVPRAALAGDHWPPAAEKRFQEALQLALAHDHAKAAEVYRSVADWPTGGEFRERARALYSAAAELEAAHELERALETYRELVRRFPASDFVPVAQRAADKLAPAGVSGGLDFERRYSEAWDVLLPAMSLHDQRRLEEARPRLERALALLDSLLRDHRDHPRATDVAVARSDVLIRLERLGEACEAAEEAVALAGRQATKPGTVPAAAGDVVNARRQLSEALRALWCRRLARAAGAILLLLGAGFVVARPWRRVTRRLLRLWLALLAGDVALSGLAWIGAEYARRRAGMVDDAIFSSRAAVALMFAPGAVGLTLALGSALVFKGRRGLALAVLAGVGGALATSVCLVQHYGFFNAFLPEL